MDFDLTDLLRSWPFDPEKATARKVRAKDEREVIQVRLEFGILQMESEGRPDGQRPHDYESLLEYFEAKADESGDGAEERFTLSPDDCAQLRAEAAQFDHRYRALLVLEDFDGVVRDTTRNLRVLDLCAKHAETEADRAMLEQFRPYITMMRARALTSQALKDNEPKAAAIAIDEALEALRRYFADRGEPDTFDQSGEVQMLQGLRQALTPKLPVSQKAELQDRLKRALAEENYELAAILRDELKNLKE